MAQQMSQHVTLVRDMLLNLELSAEDAEIGAKEAVLQIKRENILRGADVAFGDGDYDRAVDLAFTAAKRASAARESRGPTRKGEMLDLPGLHPDLPSAMQGNMTRAEIDASIAQVKDFGFEESPETIEVLLKYNKYDVQSAMEALLAFSEKGPGAAAAAMQTLEALDAEAAGQVQSEAAAAATPVEASSGGAASDPPAPPAPPREVNPTKLADKVFKQCDWVKKKRLPEGSASLSEALVNRLTMEGATVNVQRLVLAAQRPYPGCGQGVTGTLLHQLCDFPPDLETRGDFENLATLLMELFPTEAVGGEAAVLELDALRDGDSHSPLFRAVTRGHPAIVSEFLKRARGSSSTVPASAAAAANSLEVVQVDRVCSGRTALLQALSYAGGDTEQHEKAENIANMLVEHGANVNFRGTMEFKIDGLDIDATPLFAAVLTSKLKCLAVLLAAGADPNAPCAGVPPFLQAVLEGSEKAVQLLSTKCDVNVRGSVAGGARDTTCAIEAVRRYSKPKGHAVLKVVLAAKGPKGADGKRSGCVDLNALNALGESCASVAVRSGPSDVFAKLKVLEILLDHKSDGAASSQKGGSGGPSGALNLSSVDLGETLVELVRLKDKHLDLLRKLVHVGCVDVNAPGHRPLDAALKSRHEASVQMVELFLDNGADVNVGRVVDDGGDGEGSGPGGGGGSKAAKKKKKKEQQQQAADEGGGGASEQQAEDREGRGPPPLISALKLLLHEWDKDAPSQDDLNYQLLLEKKLKRIAAAPDINKLVTDPTPREDGVVAGGVEGELTAVDLLIERHHPRLASLEDQGPASFWATVGAQGDFGLDGIQEQQKWLRAKQKEVEKWGPVVEWGPAKRTQFFERVQKVEELLEKMAERREVWAKLNDKVTALEKGRHPTPVLAGMEWSDLRGDLAMEAGDWEDGTGGGAGGGGQADGDDEFYKGGGGLTNLSDLKADGTFAAAAARPVLYDGGGGGGGESNGNTLKLAAGAAPLGAPEAPSTTMEHYLHKHDLSSYLGYMEDEEVDLELLLSFLENDYDFITGEGDLDRFLLAMASEKGLQAAHAAWVATDAAGEHSDAAPTAAAAAPAAAVPSTAGGDEVEEEEEDGGGLEDGEYEGDDFVLQAVPSNIEFTRYAYQWIQRSDSTLVAMALKKINLLAEGPSAWRRSRQLSKVLEGQAHTPTKIPVREAKLDKGMRILWQERGDRSSIIVWYICKHDFISDRLRDIDNCFRRMNGERDLSVTQQEALSESLKGSVKGAASVPFGLGAGTGQGRHAHVPEVLLDPRGNTPLMVYEVQVHELPQLEQKWNPPMKLTAKEEMIVKTEGLVTIVGRSGTGKTVCVAMRMDRDAKRAAQGNTHQRSMKQVFVARSRALCAQVRRMVDSGGHQNTASGRRAVQDMERGGGGAEGGGGDGASVSGSGLAPVSAAGPMTSADLAALDEEAAPKAKFVTIDDFVGLVEDAVVYGKADGTGSTTSAVGPKPTWDRARHVRWHEFEKDFWKGYLSKTAQKGFGVKEDFSAKKTVGAGSGGGAKSKKKKAAAAAAAAAAAVGSGSADRLGEGDDGDERAEDASPLVALTVWTQIRSMIKGSAEAAWGYSHEDPPPQPRPEQASDDPALFKKWEAHDYKCSELQRSPGTPMCKTQFMRLPRGRCPLGQRQKLAAYEYFEIYEKWLASEGRWDDTDRILKLVARLKSVERNRMTTSIWRDARVPFDRIYADEVQDATQAEITLFSLSCNDNVDGLFLAGDNAQAITHGVSFRFEELRLIMALATKDFGRRMDRVSVKPLALTHNYRSHSGILEFAACFLTQLDVCFEGSFTKLVADSGLSRGPRPGVWSCPRGFASLRGALQLDERLIILTRDENARALEAELGKDKALAEHVNVLGICEAKGLEFNDVLIVDFFSSAQPHLQAAWGDLLKLNVIDPEGPLSAQGGGGGGGDGAKVAAADSAAGGGGSAGGWIRSSTKSLQKLAKGKVPLALEVDLKNLYTAVTRCRNRLILCETSTEMPQWAKFVKQYEKLGLVTDHPMSESSADGGGAVKGMMPDELVELGLEFVGRVDPEGGEPEQAKRDYHNAIKFFRRAGEQGKHMLERAEAMASHVDVWDQVKRLALEQPTDWRAREGLAADAACDLVGVGLVTDAMKLCRLASSPAVDLSVVQPLLGRLSKLDHKWRNDAEHKQQAHHAIGAAAGAGGVSFEGQHDDGS